MAVISDLDLDVIVRLKRHPAGPSVAVARGVGYRLRHDPVGRDLDGRGEQGQVLRRLDLDIEPAPIGGESIRLLPDCADEAELVEGRRTQTVHEPPHLSERLATVSSHFGDQLSGSVGPAAGEVMGWVAVSAVSSRCVYAGVVEHSVYVHPAARGQGVGRRLLDALIASTEAAGIWTIQSGIFPENAASAALHRAAGFRVVGTRERIGRHHGRWRDVVLIEWRSPAI